MHDKNLDVWKEYRKACKKCSECLGGGEIAEVHSYGMRLEQASRSGVHKSQVLVGP